VRLVPGPSRAIGLGVGVAVVAVGVAAGLMVVGGLQEDFAAYWVAGTARNMGLDPYVNHVGVPPAPELWDGVASFRHSRFLYPPLAAELFRFVAMLPFRVAKAIFTALAVAAWIAAALLTGRRGRASAAVLIAGALFFPLYLHLERGQIDLVLLVVVLGAWRLRARPVAAGALLALAPAVKPTLLLIVPVLWVLGQRRFAAAALGATAAIVTITALVSGPALLHTYAAEVLPRVARYGEGGPESALLHEDRLPVDEEMATVQARSYRLSFWDFAPWEINASASLPRLLAPETPSPWTGPLSAMIALVGLVSVGRRWRRSVQKHDDAGALMIVLAAAVASVVISPAGWAMGLVFGLPLAAIAFASQGPSRPGGRRALVAALVACAIPAPVAGWPALAGTALVVAACAGALTPPAPESLA
jgi:hypothetical protein